MMKALKYITLTMLISSALALSGLAQPDIQWSLQKDKRKEPERPVEKKKNDDRGGDKRDEGKARSPKSFSRTLF
jgi:hypothetical protein